MPQCGQNYVLVLMIQAVFGILLFLYGFFPLKVPDGRVATMDDVPSRIGNTQFPDDKFYKPVIGRLVIMVIDALRWDFVANPSGRVNMPYVSSLVEHGEACLLKGKANPPTVTMPRIKALTTGSIPNFVDVVLNLGSKEISEDNLIGQAVSRGLKVIFYGDDTWTKLFPRSFVRSEGTSSFFVTDFTEVDDNVTRHLTSELRAADWDIMVLHYLGLDHIGHLEGPKSSKVGPKLREMDRVAEEIHIRLLQWSESTNQTAAVMICGDHGMKDSGSHGGASLAEVLVPIVTLGLSCPGNRVTEPVGQIDVVPTFSVLLGVPIPLGSLGKLVPSLLHGLPVSRQLHALHYNAKVLAAQFKRHISSHSTQRSWIAYEEAVRLHSEWLASGDSSSGAASRRVQSLYSVALEEMSSGLADSLVEFDEYLLVVATVLLAQVCRLLLQASSWPGVSKREFLLFMLLLSCHVVFCAASQCRSFLCAAPSLPSVVVMALVCIVLAHNFEWLLWHTPFKMELPVATAPRFLVVGTFLHAASFASSSFIEEEHQVWYFLWATLVLLTAGHAFIPAALVLAAHRWLRKLNQTGDKWASLPDLGDWLSLPGHERYLLAIFVAGLFGVLSCCYILMPSKSKRVLSFVAVSCVFCYRAAVGNIIIPSYAQSRGVVEVQMFWSALLVMLLVGAAQRSDLRAEVPGTLAGCWALASVLLHRPHNTVLVPAQVLFSAHVHRVLGQGPVRWNALAHVWLGMLFYFYQGNSNSFASIDVAAAYVGLQDYQPYLVGTLLVCHTYSAPVLSHLLLLAGLARDRQRHSDLDRGQLAEVCRTVACARLLPLAACAALVAWQRYHLFVWTVFSPKLLYEAMHTAVTAALLLLTICSSRIVGKHSWKDSVQPQYGGHSGVAETTIKIAEMSSFKHD